ncbi:hypothetical protein Tcan_16142 [Toxocara canis]|uniref:Uncharacterized protein n=2 Tax=Toxocara canis TaxID=6265 RepID=A0A0B2VVJ2_TOXCA|nr:hypothetical protein Tcan_16167 [Toxocara canis]KHN84989.1 hypothetical protein Tcan_16142 [Toxocara canis]VDM43746.1 unnamed protein product [Toxocara canis]
MTSTYCGVGGSMSPGTTSAYFAAPGTRPSGGGGGYGGMGGGATAPGVSAYFAPTAGGGGGSGVVSAYFSPTAPGAMGGGSAPAAAPAMSGLSTKTAIGVPAGHH